MRSRINCSLNHTTQHNNNTPLTDTHTNSHQRPTLALAYHQLQLSLLAATLPLQLSDEVPQLVYGVLLQDLFDADAVDTAVHDVVWYCGG